MTFGLPNRAQIFKKIICRTFILAMEPYISFLMHLTGFATGSFQKLDFFKEFFVFCLVAAASVFCY